jgi:hypothetical protein
MDSLDRKLLYFAVGSYFLLTTLGIGYSVYNFKKTLEEKGASNTNIEKELKGIEGKLYDK